MSDLFDPDVFLAEALPAILERDARGFTAWAEVHVTTPRAMHQLLDSLAEMAAVMLRALSGSEAGDEWGIVMRGRGDDGGPEAQAVRMVVAAMNGDGPGLTGMVHGVMLSDDDYSAAVVAMLIWMMGDLAERLTEEAADGR